MAKSRVVQHRPTERSKTKEISDLKKENHGLRRRVAKLQKFLQKALETSGTMTPDPDPVAAIETLGPDTSKCPECGSTKLVQVQLPTGVLRGCKSCGWKKKE